MKITRPESHLSRITTEWTLVFQAHEGNTAEVSAAQTALMLRYCGAVHRYLLAVLRDPEAAEEVDQEFALRFLRGDFHRANPARGRFRDFVKQSLRNLMVDYQRRRRRQSQVADAEVPEPATSGTAERDFDRKFINSWRREIMAHAWESLGEFERKTGKPFDTVLRFRVEHAELPSPQMALELSTRLGRKVGAGWVRQVLSLAREKYTDYVLAEVVRSLENPSEDEIEQELVDLGLIEYCRAALKRRKGE